MSGEPSTPSRANEVNNPPPVVEQSTPSQSTDIENDISSGGMQRDCGCTGKEGCTCSKSDKIGNMNMAYVYALGRIQPRFPNLEVQKELAQAIGREEAAGLTDRQAMQTVLSARENRYLARQMCWVFSIEELETYILVPRDPTDLDLLVESLRPTPRATDVDVVLGMRGPISSPRMCNGLMLPIVSITQIYSFDIETLVKSLPRPEGIPAKQFDGTVEDVFSRIMQMADNAGATDEHRALNYLSVRYKAIYTNTADMFGKNFSLTSLDVRPSRLSGARKVLDVIFSYTNRSTDVTEKYFVRVDVTGEFPFLVTKFSPYYER
jgi:hypothetical protein